MKIMRRLLQILFLSIVTLFLFSCDNGTGTEERASLEYATGPSQDLDQIIEETPSDFTWDFYGDNIEVSMNSGPQWSGEIVLEAFQVEGGEVVNRLTTESVETSVDELADGLLTENMYPSTRWYPTTRWISTEEMYPSTRWYPTTRWSPSEIESQAMSQNDLNGNQSMVVVYARMADDSPDREQTSRPFGIIFEEQQPTTGTLEAIISTEGSDKDSDGYTLTVDNGSGISAEPTDTVYATGLSEGNHEVELSEVASNCSVSGENPRFFDITAGDTTSTTYEINCQALANNKVAFTSDRDGNNEIYLMNADGSNPERLTNNAANDRQPVISHDGAHIAFISDRSGSPNLYVMDVDGSDANQLTDSSAETFLPSWSPDDSKLAFSDARNTSDDGAIYTINVDGSSEERLTYTQALDSHASWSADGNKIAFASDRGGSNDIYKMNADGSDVEAVTDDSSENFAPRWSPDGSKIAIARRQGGSQHIYTMDLNGLDLTRITENGMNDSPSWSPDGSEIVFQTDRDGNQEIYKINADGTGNVVNLTVDNASDVDPFWSPLE